jgi:DNA-binding MarR family transcriptional regulator
MPADPPSSALCAKTLRHTLAPLAKKLRPNLRSDGISVAKLSVIGQIHRAGALTPTELATLEGVKLQTLTRLLAELEIGGWLRRTRDAADGRRSLLSLTPRGGKRLSEAARDKHDRLARLIELHLSVAERSQLLAACALLERLDVAWSATQVSADAADAGGPANAVGAAPAVGKVA